MCRATRSAPWVDGYNLGSGWGLGLCRRGLLATPALLRVETAPPCSSSSMACRLPQSQLRPGLSCECPTARMTHRWFLCTLVLTCGTCATRRRPHIGLTSGCAVKIVWTAEVPACLTLPSNLARSHSGGSMADVLGEQAVLRIHNARVDPDSGLIASTVRSLAAPARNHGSDLAF